MTKCSDSDVERVEKFRETFHQMSAENYWADIRQHGRVDRLSEFTFNIDYESGRFAMRPSAMTDRDAGLVAVHVRKFMLLSEPVCIDHVLHSLAALGAGGDFFDETQSQWDQLVDRRFPLLVANGKSVGMRFTPLPGRTVWWDKENHPNVSECTTEDVSLHEFAEVHFNEGLFHAFEPRRNEERRAIVRTVPRVLLRSMAYLAMSATLCAATLLHLVTLTLDPRWQCGDECQEWRLLQERGDGLIQP